MMNDEITRLTAKLARAKEPVCAIVDGKPHHGMALPDNVEFVGMEATPNQKPRYGKVWHPWHNLPCYETEGE